MTAVKGIVFCLPESLSMVVINALKYSLQNWPALHYYKY